LRQEHSPEVRRRVQHLLESLEAPLVRPGPTLRDLRAVQLLERCGTRGATRNLESLAEGAPEARLTQEAKAALERLAQRPAADR
jgi:hypothetical protein